LLQNNEVVKSSALYLQKINKMESTKKNTGLFWILFLLSVAGFFAVLYSPLGAYCSMVLPFNFTFFAKALDLM
jgi:hypothetical protein